MTPQDYLKILLDADANSLCSGVSKQRELITLESIQFFSSNLSNLERAKIV